MSKEDRAKGILCAMEEHGQCCCTCKWQYVDRSHPGTDGKPMSHTRGYICAEPFLGYHSDWWHHSVGCECYTKRPERPDPPLNDYNSDLWYEAEAWDACYARRDDYNSDAMKTWEILDK